MHLKLTGHHVEVTQSLRAYVEKKLERIMRHFDQVIDVHCTMTVEKLQHKAEATVHVRGGNIHAVRRRTGHVRGHRLADRQARAQHRQAQGKDSRTTMRPRRRKRAPVLTAATLRPRDGRPCD